MNPEPTSTPAASRRDLLERSLVTIRDLRTRLEAAEQRRTESIAIVGLACRFPGGGSTPEQFWTLLQSGATAIGPVPPGRWQHAGPDAGEGVAGGFLREDVAGFDPHFFSISPREAEEMDPQHRLLLEVSWEALERAAIDPHSLRGSRTGFFVGLSGSEYGMLPRAADAFSPYTATGLTANLASGRLAYFYGTHGPALSIDTACSSSLVAVHLACRSLQAGECERAVAAGVNALLSPQPFHALRELGALARDGRCKTFSADADGYGRGEGCGAVVLKRLSRAEADGDRILAVIRGSAVNQDGASSGLTVPNGLAQQALQREALAAAGVSPAEIDFLETHGTGTPLGDPIEVQSIRAVHQGRGGRPLYLGAVKSAIGHLEAAAGIAGLIKVVLSLQRQTLPPQPVAGALNPRLDLAAIPAALAPTAQPWSTERPARLAAVSSFGFSGTNAHLIVSDPPTATRPALTPFPTSGQANDPVSAPLLLKLTADTDAAVAALATRYREWLQHGPETDLAAFCWTANVGRASLAKRQVIVVRDRATLLDALQAVAVGTAHRDVLRANDSVATSAGQPDSPMAVARAFVAGETVDWNKLTPRPAGVRPLDLPTYPFQRRSYWLAATNSAEPLASSGRLSGDRGALPSLSAKLLDAATREQVVEFELNRLALPDAADNQGVLHVGHYQALVAASLTAAERPRSASAAVPAGSQGWEFTAAEFLFLLRLPDTGSVRVQVTLAPDEHGRRRYGVHSRSANDGRWVLHAQGRVARASAVVPAPAPEFAGKDQWSGAEFYARLREQGFGLGPAVSLVREVTFAAGVAVARIAAPAAPAWSGLSIAPAVFDVCGQLLFAAAGTQVGPRTTFMVARWERLTVGPQSVAGELRCRLTLRRQQTPPASPPLLVADYSLESLDGTVVATAEGVGFQLLEPERLAQLQRAVEAIQTTSASTSPQPPRDAAAAREAVRRIVSAAARVPASELDPAEPLRRLGVDSIVGVEIKGRIERELGVSLPLERFIVGPSIDELAREITATAGAAPVIGPAARRDAWLVREIVRPAARLRLFCVPSGSLGASQYRGWAERLPAEIEVCAVQLPGREERFGEAPFERLDDLLSAMEDALGPELDRPYALYGHSMGALIAYRLAYRLWQRGPRKPSHLFPGAYTSPALPNPIVAKYRRRFQAAGLPGIPGPRDRAGHAVAAQFVREGLAGTNALDTDELAGAMLTTMLADMAVVQDYRPDAAEPPFDVPITVFHGDRDADVTLAQMERWRELTTGEFDCRVLAGDHFFMHQSQARDALVSAIGSILRPRLSAAPAGSSSLSHPHTS